MVNKYDYSAFTAPNWLWCIIPFHSTAPSGRPHNITVLNVTSNSIYLSWTAPDPSQQNGVIWRYLIYLTANDYSITYSTSTSSTTYNLTDLNPYTSYQVKVAAVTISPGPNSTAETIKTGETGMTWFGWNALVYTFVIICAFS